MEGPKRVQNSTKTNHKLKISCASQQKIVHYGIVAIVIGIIMAAADIFFGYPCNCPALIDSQSCSCAPPGGYYGFIIISSVISLIGLVSAVKAIKIPS